MIEITKDTNYGGRLGILRTVNSFGELSAETYRKFALTFKNYFERNTSHSASKIAYDIRCILSGGALEEDELNFLPNLVAAWFLGEPIRNSMSTLTGLMLLDLIESNIQLLDSKGRNLYDWQYTLTHPDKLPKEREKPLKFKDLYGNELAKVSKDGDFKTGKDGDGLGKFHGSHPMVHGGSVKDSNVTLGNNQNLTPVRQKEGSIIIHWLSKILQGEGLNCKAESADITPLVIPNYDMIDTLLKCSTKPSKKIQKDLTQLKKWELLHEFIIPCFKQRLVTLDNLLETTKPTQIKVTHLFSSDQITKIIEALNNGKQLNFTKAVHCYLPSNVDGSLEKFIEKTITENGLSAAAINISPNFINQSKEANMVLYFVIKSKYCGDNYVYSVLLSPMESFFDHLMNRIIERIKAVYREHGIEHTSIDIDYLESQEEYWGQECLTLVEKLYDREWELTILDDEMDLMGEN